MVYKFFTMGTIVSILIISCLLFPSPKVSNLNSQRPIPPRVVYKLGSRESSLLQLPDGSFMLLRMAGKSLISLTSIDGNTWSDPKVEIENYLNEEFLNFGGPGIVALLDKEGELHLVYQVFRDVQQKPSEIGKKNFQWSSQMYDIWHLRTTKGRSKWELPKMIFEGYTSDVMDFKQLDSGRLIIPFGYWVPGQSPLPRGMFTSTVIYSDDDGKTWNQSNAKLTSPTYENYNGNNYGAIEASIVELFKKGHLYSLFRTQTGFLYESYSNDNGNTWIQAKASRFHMFDGPALLKELPNNRIFMVWNNSDRSPNHKGMGVYGGRDAIHAAISDDDGKTWRGFREIHRDPLRNETPPKKGDRGTSYANSAVVVDGKVMLITGMGVNRRHIVSVDPNWLTLKRHRSDFSHGLEEWSVFKHIGLASGWWRDRIVGPELVEHPSKKGVKVLHIRRPDEKDADGAVWNFPNGRSGNLSLRIMLNKGFGGGSIALTDRFFNPSDNHGERLAMFNFSISNKGELGNGQSISIGQWHTLNFKWDIDNKSCNVIINGKVIFTIPQSNETLNGLSYLRLRSTSPIKDTAGYFIESVVVDINDNIAPTVREGEKQLAEVQYRSKLSAEEF